MNVINQEEVDINFMPINSVCLNLTILLSWLSAVIFLAATSAGNLFVLPVLCI
ncbi:MAG: hypothetical protein LBH99_04435 [Rickettsia sp.]|jgi:hypothetical protein|nr:hypothetical protein [Rickettsia sp.]